MTPSFIHLHVHTEYSLIKGIVRIDELIEKCKALQMPAVAITDRTNLFAAVKFFKEAVAEGVKAILGVEILLENEIEKNKPFSLILLCQNKVGYQNLTRLISRAYVEGQSNGFAAVKKEWLVGNVEGLIALSGGVQGDIGQAIINQNIPLMEKAINFWQQLFQNRFYLEITRTGKAEEEVYNKKLLEISRQLAVPLVATNNVCFIEREDFDAHDARVCIHDGYVLADPKRPRFYTPDQYFKSAAEMQQLFADIPSALQNTVEIAKRCNLQLTLNEVFLPNFPTPNQNLTDYLIAEAEKGLVERFTLLALNAEQQDHYRQRLAIELEVINNMGFAGYFLIVADFIRWAKENGVPVGPGRGSGAGSLVAYALGITNLDPIAYDLLFERFLNPERISLPDFDIDFCMEGRDRVIDYVASKYGRESVSQIITFGTMAARAVIRDVGRVLSHPYGFVDKLAKLIPFEIGITLEKALKQEDILRNRYKDEEEVKNLLDLCQKLEGLVRNAGKHAGGVVISPTKVTDFTPLYCEANSTHVVTQFDKDDVEAVGLVKFDFLGLRTLTIINWALQTITSRNKDSVLNIDTIPIEDTATFDLLKKCNTTGVFQLESRGMKDLIKRLQPDNFEEIIALVALFRPGPLQSGMVDDFINRKLGRATFSYLHPELETILRPTYGVIVYQEQVMQIAQVLAGYTLGGADLLRRAMGKKKPEEMASQRAIFLAGSHGRGIDPVIANQIFDLMEMFAGYGFNKSHSAAYALVSYQTAWLKAHYPAAFLAAVLSAEMDHTEKVVTFIKECRLNAITVIPPSVNQSHYKFEVQDDATILYGLGAIKGVGFAAIENIVHEREDNGPYRNLFDFCSRVDLRKVNKRVLESMIRSGGFDCFGEHRATLMANLPYALKRAEQHSQDIFAGQDDMFGGGNDDFSSQDETYKVAKEWSEEERLRGERDTLGHYITGHPLRQYAADLQAMVTSTLGNVHFKEAKSFVIAGMVADIRTFFTKRGERMAFLAVCDEETTLELAVFADTYAEKRDLLTADQLVVLEIEGSIDSTGNTKINARRIWSLEDARIHFAKYLLLRVAADSLQQDVIDSIKNALIPFCSGQIPVCIEYQREEAKARINLDAAWKILPSQNLIVGLRELLGAEAVELCY